ncbi:MAG: serine/threonine-protein kinase [Deltaproteobacteria bacterium]|nr:serine/threonine-protein kinase [Deltaproteobacteria bacterium]
MSSAQSTTDSADPKVDGELTGPRLEDRQNATSPAIAARIDAGAGQAVGAAVGAREDRHGKLVGGRYRIIGLLGEGGMGAVYSGEHITLQKKVAIKFLHAEMSRAPDIVARFKREAIAAATLEHPNVVAVHDFGSDETGAFFLVMDLIDGRSLTDDLEQSKRFSLPRVRTLAAHVCAALSRAHSESIVHRDLKPDNIVLVQRGDDPDFAKVIDFGIAKVGARMAGGQALTQTGMVFGTPEYMSPEQALGADVDHRADLYALGVVLFECVTGQRPFLANDVVELLGQQMAGAIPLVGVVAPDANLPTSLDDFFAKALAKRPSERFESAEALLRGLDDALAVPSASESVPLANAISPEMSSANAALAAPRPTFAEVTSPILRQGATITRDSVMTVASATESAWNDLASDRPRKRLLLGTLAGFSIISMLFAIGSVRQANARRTLTTPTPTLTAPAGPLVQRPRAAQVLSLPTLPTLPTHVPPPLDTHRAFTTQLAEFQRRPVISILLDRRSGMNNRNRRHAIEQLLVASPNDTMLTYTLATLEGDAGRSAYLAMLDHYAQVLAHHPDASTDETLLDDVTNAALNGRGDVATRASSLLQNQLRTSAPPRILERLIGERNVRNRNRQMALLRETFPTYVDPPVEAIFVLEQARTCAAIRVAVDALASTGDERAVPALSAIPRPPRRCGWFGVCNPCLEDSVDRALLAARSRAAPHS